MGCDNDTGPFIGGLYEEIFVKDSEIVNGTITGTELSNVSVSGSMELDEKTLEQLGKALCPHVAGCVEIPIEDVAAVFKNCAGAPHTPGASVPTCDEMQQAIEAGMQFRPVAQTPEETTDTDIPTTIIGTVRDKVLGKPDAYLKLGEYLVPAYFAKA